MEATTSKLDDRVQAAKFAIRSIFSDEESPKTERISALEGLTDDIHKLIDDAEAEEDSIFEMQDTEDEEIDDDDLDEEIDDEDEDEEIDEDDELDEEIDEDDDDLGGSDDGTLIEDEDLLDDED